MSHAQSLEAGIQHYQQKEYKEALSIFKTLSSPESSLFAGKSYYALRRYDEAENVLNDLLENAPPRIFYEAIYTSALVDFQQKEFGRALNKLYRVFNKSAAESLAENARQLYQQILDYLTGRQRMLAMNEISSAQIKYQLIESAIGKVGYDQAKQLINKFSSSTDEQKWRKKIASLESSISNASAYQIKYEEELKTSTPPEGTVYNFGVALPQFSPDDPEFEIVRSLFLGAKVAAEEYNGKHSDTKVYLSFLPTGSGDMNKIVETFSQKEYGDVIIGPLFSEQARPMVELSLQYHIPVVAPLANAVFESSESLFFQINSTFPVHGKMMARFAMKELGMDRFAVLAAKNTNDVLSAEAFRKEIERLGGEVVYYFVKDLKSNGYDISPYTKYFGSKGEPIDAVYAPFTGSRASFLIGQLAEDNNTLANPVTLLGSQKWGDVNFVSDVYSRGDIYYSVSAYRSETIADFENRYRRQFNFRPNQFAAIGYDVTHYLLQILGETGNPALLAEKMQQYPFYRGLIKNIDFDGTNINHAVKILKVGSNGNLILQHSVENLLN